jgi:hypothetical protein
MPGRVYGSSPSGLESSAAISSNLTPLKCNNLRTRRCSSSRSKLHFSVSNCCRKNPKFLPSPSFSGRY